MVPASHGRSPASSSSSARCPLPSTPATPSTSPARSVSVNGPAPRRAPRAAPAPRRPAPSASAERLHLTRHGMRGVAHHRRRHRGPARLRDGGRQRYPPAAQHRDVVRHLEHLVELVRHQQHRRALRRHRADRRQQPASPPRARAPPSARRAAPPSPRGAAPSGSPPAAARPRRASPPRRSDRRAARAPRPASAPAASIAGRSSSHPPRPATGLGAQHDVLGDGERLGQHEVLVHHADARVEGGADVAGRELDVVDRDAPGVGRDEAAEAPDEGALARAVLADEGVHPAGREVERGAVERHAVAVDLAQSPRARSVGISGCWGAPWRGGRTAGGCPARPAAGG